jgi:hypothetical protein
MPLLSSWAVPYCIWIVKSARIAKIIGHCRSIKCRSNDCRSNDCRSIECRSNDCRSIECRSNDIIRLKLKTHSGFHDLFLNYPCKNKLTTYGFSRGHRSLDRMVVRFTNTCAMSAYYH